MFKDENFIWQIITLVVNKSNEEIIFYTKFHSFVLAVDFSGIISGKNDNFFFFSFKAYKICNIIFQLAWWTQKNPGWKVLDKSIKYRHISDKCKYKKIGESNVFFKMFYDFFLYKLIMLLLFL